MTWGPAVSVFLCHMLCLSNTLESCAGVLFSKIKYTPGRAKSRKVKEKGAGRIGCSSWGPKRSWGKLLRLILIDRDKFILSNGNKCMLVLKVLQS